MLPSAKSRHGSKHGKMPDIARLPGSVSQPHQALGSPEPEVRKREQSFDDAGSASLGNLKDLISRIDEGDGFARSAAGGRAPDRLQQQDILAELRGAQPADKAPGKSAASQRDQIGSRQPVETWLRASPVHCSVR
jgi:hypothetical protein